MVLILLTLIFSLKACFAEVISIDLPLAMESSPMKTSISANVLGGMRIWWQNHGIESFSAGWFDYRISRVRYLHKTSENAYWSVGIGEIKYRTSGWGIGFPPSSSTAEYTENPIYFGFGSEQPFIYDWLITNYEIGYIVSSVNNFSGDPGKHPESRFYVAGAIGARIKI